MGICCSESERPRMECGFSTEIFGVTVKINTGNVFDSDAEVIIVPSNDLLKIRSEDLNENSVRLLMKNAEYLARHGKTEIGDSIQIHRETGQKVIFAICPSYIDGTLGEPDYLRSAFSKAITSALQPCPSILSISADWIYPKRPLITTLSSLLIPLLHHPSLNCLSIFCNSPQSVFPM